MKTIIAVIVLFYLLYLIAQVSTWLGKKNQTKNPKYIEMQKIKEQEIERQKRAAQEKLAKEAKLRAEREAKQEKERKELLISPS